MLNFETMDNRYRERIRWDETDLMDYMVKDHLLKGGKFDARKITEMFDIACQTAQLIVDLEIGSGLHKLEKEENAESNQESSEEIIDRINRDSDKEFVGSKAGRNSYEESIGEARQRIYKEGTDELISRGNEISDLGKGDSEGPTGSVGDEVGVRDSDSGPDQISNNRAAGSGKINLAEQQPKSPVTGPGEGRGHVSGPEGS